MTCRKRAAYTRVWPLRYGIPSTNVGASTTLGRGGPGATPSTRTRARTLAACGMGYRVPTLVRALLWGVGGRAPPSTRTRAHTLERGGQGATPRLTHTGVHLQRGTLSDDDTHARAHTCNVPHSPTTTHARACSVPHSPTTTHTHAHTLAACHSLRRRTTHTPHPSSLEPPPPPRLESLLTSSWVWTRPGPWTWAWAWAWPWAWIRQGRPCSIWMGRPCSSLPCPLSTSFSFSTCPC